MESETGARRVPHLARIAAAALIAVGVAALYEATGLPFGTVYQPGTGFFPMLVAVAVIFFAAIALAERPVAARSEDAGKPGSAARVWTVIAALAIYALAFKTVGFIICTALLLIVLLRGIGRVSWIATGTWVVSGSVGCYWMFTRLGLPLPAGLFAF